MTNQELFIASENFLTGVVDQIKDGQWNLEMPADFQSWGEGPHILLPTPNYHAYDDAWVPETLTGKTIAEVGTKYDGDLLGSDPKTNWHTIVDKAIDAVRSCDPERTVHLTYGDFPTHEYLLHITSFRAFRGVDFARAIGVSDRWPSELAQGLTEILLPRMDEYRAMGVFPAALPAPADGDQQAILLAASGRQPS